MLRIGKLSKKSTVHSPQSTEKNKIPWAMGHGPWTGFTLIELLVSVAVIAIGMVFILGAFNQCMSSIVTAQRMVSANYLFNAKIWEIDNFYKINNGSEPGGWKGVFEEPYQNFNWEQVVNDGISASLDNEGLAVGQAGLFVQENLNEETLAVSWQQGRVIKNISVTRYVKKKK